MPMVAFYIFGDQLYNADRIARRGYGVKLNLLDFSAQNLVDAINEVMHNDTYRQRIKMASEIFRNDRTHEVAADAVEHAIEFGSDHLRPDEALSMSIPEFCMLDIVLLMFVVTTVLSYVTVKLFLCTTKHALSSLLLRLY
jgi:glucuronosyltransferase